MNNWYGPKARSFLLWILISFAYFLKISSQYVRKKSYDLFVSSLAKVKRKISCEFCGNLTSWRQCMRPDSSFSLYFAKISQFTSTGSWKSADVCKIFIRMSWILFYLVSDTWLMIHKKPGSYRVKPFQNHVKSKCTFPYEHTERLKNGWEMVDGETIYSGLVKKWL